MKTDYTMELDRDMWTRARQNGGKVVVDERELTISICLCRYKGAWAKNRDVGQDCDLCALVLDALHVLQEKRGWDSGQLACDGETGEFVPGFMTLAKHFESTLSKESVDDTVFELTWHALDDVEVLACTFEEWDRFFQRVSQCCPARRARLLLPVGPSFLTEQLPEPCVPPGVSLHADGLFRQNSTTRGRSTEAAAATAVDARGNHGHCTRN
jgi:hypothetical protein